MAQQYFSWLRAVHWTPVLAASLLAACGGGGGQPAATNGDVAPLAANTSTIGIPYRVAELVQGSQNNHTHRLSVVDTRTGQEVWHTFVAQSEFEAFSWTVSQASDWVAGTSTSRYLGPRLLHYVSGGQVFEVDIGGSVPPTPHRISNVADACALNSALSVELDGRHVWLAVRTSGPDQDCAQTADNGLALVASAMPATTSPLAAPGSQKVVLNRLPNAQSGASTGILTLDSNLRRIVVRSNDLTQILHTLPGDVPPDQFIRILAPLPGQVNQWLVLVGASLRVFDQRGATPALGPVLATLADSLITPVYAMDAQGLYIANGHQVLSISAAGTVSTFTTLPSDGGTIDGLWLSKNAVLALQHEGGGGHLPVTGRVLWSIQRGTATRQALVQGQPYDDTTVVHVENGLVHYTQAEDNLTDVLRKIRDNGQGQTLVASGIRMITEVIHPEFKPDTVSLQKLVWCEPLPQRGDCGDAPLVAYDTSRFSRTALGTLPANGANFTAAHVLEIAWAGALTPLHVPRYYTTDDGQGGLTQSLDTGLWLFNADVANSLAAVTLMP